MTYNNWDIQLLKSSVKFSWRNSYSALTMIYLNITLDSSVFIENINVEFVNGIPTMPPIAFNVIKQHNSRTVKVKLFWIFC